MVKNPQQIRDRVLARMLGREFHPKPECPFCYSLNVSYETVDVGVGAGMKCGPTECGDCGSQEMFGTSCQLAIASLSHSSIMFGIYPEEAQSGWFNQKYMQERMELNDLGINWQACAVCNPEERAKYLAYKVKQEEKA